MKRRGQSNLLVVTIVAAAIIGIGLFMWSLLSGYAVAYRLKALEEFNAETLVLRSLISADYVIYPGGEAYIRNIGKEPVVIFRLITLRNGHVAWDSFHVHGVREIARIEVGELDKVIFNCPECSREDLIVLQVHYIPAELYDQSNPELINPTSDVILFRVASFKAEELIIAPGGLCPISEKWAWTDYVDPLEEGGAISNKLKIKLSRASHTEYVLLHAKVIDRDNDGAEGEKIIPSISSGEEEIELTKQSDLEYPAEIHLSIETPNWTLIQNHWRFLNDITAYVDKVILIWSPYTYRLTGAFLTINYNDDGMYRVGIRAYDCYGNLIAEGKIEDRQVSRGDYRELKLDYGLELDRNPLMSDVYMIEVYVIDISETVTKTHTLTETSTITSTLTITETIIIPEATAYQTNTRTSTQTTTTATTSYVTYYTTIPSTTITTTATTTRTITRTSYTSTTTITRTGTLTVTATSTATTSRTTTITIPQVTRTTTQTVTITAPTTLTTSTITQTITSYVTVTTVTTTSTSTISSIISYTTTMTITIYGTECPVGSPSQKTERSLQAFVFLSMFLAPALCMFKKRWKNGS